MALRAADAQTRHASEGDAVSAKRYAAKPAKERRRER
jgi:hypothetical protein